MVEVAVAEIGCNAILLTMYLVNLILYNIIDPPPTGDLWGMIAIDLRTARLNFMRQQYHCIGVERCDFTSLSMAIPVFSLLAKLRKGY